MSYSIYLQSRYNMYIYVYESDYKRKTRRLDISLFSSYGYTL